MDCLAEKKKIPINDIRDSEASHARTPEQFVPSKLNKKAGTVAVINFDRLMEQHMNRSELLRTLNLNVTLKRVNG